MVEGEGWNGGRGTRTRSIGKRDLSCTLKLVAFGKQLFPKFLRLHGKTYDYKILYTSVIRLFLLPKPDQRHFYFVISLDPPIRKYPMLVLHFPVDDTVEGLDLNLEGDEEVREKFAEVGTSMSGPTHEVVSRLFKTLTGRKVSCLRAIREHEKKIWGRGKAYHQLHNPVGFVGPFKNCHFLLCLQNE